jgi:CRISPR-associated protein Cas2
MYVIVSYDVATATPEGRRRLRRVAKACVDYGQRVQNSVFECAVDPAQWTLLRNRLMEEFNAEEDSLRFYFLGNEWRHRVEHHGTKNILDLEAALVV